MTSHIESPDGPIITGIDFDEEWVIVTYQEPIPPGVAPLVITNVQKRVNRQTVGRMVDDLIVAVGDLLDESARFEHGPPGPDRIPQS